VTYRTIVADPRGSTGIPSVAGPEASSATTPP
jgi:hypothetical protein